MYLLFKMVIFQPVIFVFKGFTMVYWGQRSHVQLGPSKAPYFLEHPKKDPFKLKSSL